MCQRLNSSPSAADENVPGLHTDPAGNVDGIAWLFIFFDSFFIIFCVASNVDTRFLHKCFWKSDCFVALVQGEVYHIPGS